MNYIVNSDLDICIKITKKGEEDQYDTLFLLESGHTNKIITNNKIYKSNMKSYLKKSKVKGLDYNFIGLNGYQNKDFMMNSKYIFFQDKHEITFFELDKQWDQEPKIIYLSAGIPTMKSYDGSEIKEI